MLVHWLKSAIAPLLVLGMAGWSQAAPSAQDIVLYPGTIPVGQIHGSWAKVADASAAGGFRMHNPDNGALKVAPALASPTNYFEMTFQASANVPYRIWARQLADGNSTSNDSTHIQFDHSVDLNGTAIFRIGSTDSAEMVLEEVSGRNVHGWGWQDNGWGARIVGNCVIFNSSGTQTLRVQQREDGVSVDQIVLSPTVSSYFGAAPGAMKDDATILAQSGPTPDILLYASEASVKVGPWSVFSDATAAGGSAIKEADGGLPKVVTPVANPTSYFEMTFLAQAHVSYHMWMRIKAPNTSSDSVHVQFDHSIDSTGAANYRIGSTTSIEMVLEDGSGAGISNWGWRDSKWGTTVAEIRVVFDTSGLQTIRCQRREDGPEIDQILFSPAEHLTASPGVEKNDTTILSKSAGLAPPVDTDLHILECNIHKCRSTAEINDPERTASEMVLMNPTVIGANEVLTSSSHPTLLQGYLQKKTGVPWYYYFAPASSGNTQGVLLLSKVPFDKNGSGQDITSTKFLPSTEGAGQAQISINGHPVNFIVTHLNADSASIRQTQVTALLPWAATFAEPRIIMGDFNAAQSDSELSSIKSAYNESWPLAVTAGVASSYGDNPAVAAIRTRRTHLDYVWISKSATNLSLLDASVPDMRDPATFSTSGDQNTLHDYLAVGLWTDPHGTGPESLVLNTHDDKGIRASDHNWTNIHFHVN